MKRTKLKIYIPTTSGINKMSYNQLFALRMSLNNASCAIARSTLNMKDCYREMNKINRKEKRVESIIKEKFSAEGNTKE